MWHFKESCLGLEREEKGNKANESRVWQWGKRRQKIAFSVKLSKIRKKKSLIEQF